MHLSQSLSLVSGLIGVANAAASQAFSWKNVRIGGGGGFVPGIVFNPSLKGLAYARTDIGGAYKLNPADDTWTPLTDFANNTSWHDWGIDALATDPVDPNRLYLAVGLYTISWDPSVGSILRSTDQGTTWSETKLPFKVWIPREKTPLFERKSRVKSQAILVTKTLKVFGVFANFPVIKVGGNMPGRGMGERLKVDPNLNSILYFGARSGNGLWKSTDYGATWAKVTAFKWPGTYVQDASAEYTADIVGIAWITFDSTSGTKGKATPRIFVGIADVGQSVFKSEDGGVTWAWVSGEPQLGFLPHKGVLSPAEKTLYISYSNGAGPYDGTNGTVHKYNIATGAWTNISPASLTDGYYGYGGLTVDLQKPGTIMVGALNCWWPDELIWRSTDSGATWSPIWSWNGYPALNFYYNYDISAAPWLQDPASTADFKSRVGWMVESLEIDPFDSNHWLYGTGATIYGGHDLLKWDTVHNVTLKSMATGIEETAVLGLLTPPGGPPLLSAVGDIGGFYHTNLDVAPNQPFHTPTYGTTNDLDYAGNKPANIVRAGSRTTASTTDIQVAVSNDFGVSWNPFYGASASTAAGKVAISADADTVLLMSTGSGALVSRYTATFAAVPSLPIGAAIASDKRNNAYFYGGYGGSFYVSSNIGVTFAKTVALGSSTTVNQIRVHPTVAGDVWASTDVGLFHSVDFGKTFTQVGSGVTAGWSFALGAGSTTSSYPVIYGFFTVDGTTSLFKSEDKGSNWVWITDAAHGFGSASGNVVGADSTKYGKVYVGTNGRGIFYGSPSGTLPATSVTSKMTSTSTSMTSTLMTTTSKVTTSSTSSMKTTSTSKSMMSTSTTSAPATGGTSTPYGQCGGMGYTGPTICPTGWKCSFSNAWYSQCTQ